MLKAEVEKYFSDQGCAPAVKIAQTLRITRQSVQEWGEVIPLKRAIALEALTRGKLKFRKELYQ